MPENLTDVFGGDAFSVIALTDAINNQIYKPGRVSQLGVFTEEGIASTTVAIEEVSGALRLVPNTPRGAPGQQNTPDKRKLRSIRVTHLPVTDKVMADEVQGVREFGSSSALKSVQSVVTARLAQMGANLEVTNEYHRLGAIKGVLLDSDGVTVIVNLFTEFGVTQDTVNFALGTASTDVRSKCHAVLRLVESALGGGVYDHVHCFCGAGFLDALTGHTKVEKAYEQWLSGEMLRADARRRFVFGGITFEEYVGKAGSVDFIGADDAHFFPVGVPGLFKTYYAPADYAETVNTLGLPLYAKAAPDAKFNKFVELEAQKNPLNLCTRPKVLVKGQKA